MYMMKLQVFNRRYPLRALWKIKGNVARALFKGLRGGSVIWNWLYYYVGRRIGLKKVPMPYSIMIEPTSKCNYSCPMCAKNELGQEFRNQNIDGSTFDGLIDEIKGSCVIAFLWNFGEPLMNPKLTDMIEILSKERIYSVVSTNASLLDSEKSGELLKSGLNHLIISLDGTNAEEYGKLRPGGNFEKVLSNVRKMSELCTRYNSSMLIELQFIITSANENSINRMGRIGEELGVDVVTLRKCSIRSEEGHISLGAKNKEYSYGEFAPKICGRSCYKVYSQSLVLSNGDIVPCCDVEEKRNVMGNLGKLSFREIWNSKKYNSFRMAVSRGTKECRLCPDKVDKGTTSFSYKI